MIASCLCYLLLPAARLCRALSRALSGTGPASLQAGAGPGQAPRGRGGLRRVGPYDLLPWQCPGVAGGPPPSPPGARPGLQEAQARPATPADGPSSRWLRGAAVSPEAGWGRAEAASPRPGLQSGSRARRSLLWGLGEGWQLRA